MEHITAKMFREFEHRNLYYVDRIINQVLYDTLFSRKYTV